MDFSPTRLLPLACPSKRRLAAKNSANRPGQFDRFIALRRWASSGKFVGIAEPPTHRQTRQAHLAGAFNVVFAVTDHDAARELGMLLGDEFGQQIAFVAELAVEAGAVKLLEIGAEALLGDDRPGIVERLGGGDEEAQARLL